MKLKAWLVMAMLAGGVTFGIRGGCVNQSSPPDEELAEHLDQLCEIARDHIEAPEKGVRKLGRYLGKHADDMFGDFGGTLAVIERIDDDRKHDDRARVARDRIQKPLRTCERDWERFADAVEADPAAAALVDRFARRLNRTFEIIFSSTESSPRLRTLPRQLLERFER
ncbi:MAG: hypothetical protein H0T89_11805 [Deltaproteobacteria bacterium]|nr:hypothetical protein [Deltaproteobacteria bacterium]MDQ3297192.1 hypothetical protein [Myxococcota bacterium]